MSTPNPFHEPFTWKGLEFLWNGRRGRFEHASVAGGAWWVTTTPLRHFTMLNEQMQKEREDGMDWVECRWLACGGFGGDGAVRDTRDGALDSAMQLSLRYHHECIAKLRAIEFGAVPT